MFIREGKGIRHSWATELMFAPRDEGEDPRHVDSIWPIWSVLDMTPEGRGTEPDFPSWTTDSGSLSINAEGPGGSVATRWRYPVEASGSPWTRTVGYQSHWL
jgi:hypothetical protein